MHRALLTTASLSIASLALLASSPAEAALFDQELLTKTDTVFVGGMPYGSDTDGEWTYTGDIYQGAPIYEHETSGWKMYRRADGKWHVDFDEISEDWSGTIAYGTASAQTPWDTTWNGADYVVTRQGAVILSWSSSTGRVFSFDGETYSGKPVYQYGTSEYIYYKNGQWIDGPTLGSSTYYAKAQCETPWNCTWSHYDTVVHAVTEVTHDSSATSWTTFGYEGDINEGDTAFARPNGSEYVYFKNDQWINGPTLGSSSYYAKISCGTAWGCGVYSHYDTFVLKGAVTSNTSVALKTKYGTYAKVNDAGTTFSANSTSVGTRKIFNLIELNTGYVLLQAHNGNFVCDSGSGLEATAVGPDDTCYFTLFSHNDGKVSFMTYNGQYVDADGIKNIFITDIDIHSNQNEIANKEKFTLVVQ